MNGAILMVAALAVFAFGYIFYSKRTEKLIGIDPERPTPANAQRDDIDYVPAHPMVLFGHHFAAIAGAGPIVGPVLAVQFGWACVALWIILGCPSYPAYRRLHSRSIPPGTAPKGTA